MQEKKVTRQEVLWSSLGLVFGCGVMPWLTIQGLATGDPYGPTKLLVGAMLTVGSMSVSPSELWHLFKRFLDEDLWVAVDEVIEGTLFYLVMLILSLGKDDEEE